MAIDTLSKRVSSLRMTLPFPDGDIEPQDRQHITWNYSGISASLPVPISQSMQAVNTQLHTSGNAVLSLLQCPTTRLQSLLSSGNVTESTLR